jgi:DNA-damage-inducible protein D
MESGVIQRLHKNFEDYVNYLDEVEFWFARDLQNLLGYSEWRNFQKVVDKAKESCNTSKHTIDDDFRVVKKTVQLGKGNSREIEDIILTRYACYLVAQNGDPRKEEIAFAQSYFAVQTRKQEIVQEHIEFIERLKAREKLKESEIEFSKTIYERGVDKDGFARIRSKGDQSLFGGYSTKIMKNKMGVPQNRPLADFLPTVTISAKNFATEITNFNVKKIDLHGEDPISKEHVKNNYEVRELLVKRGIKPEELPPAEDLNKLKRVSQSQEKTLLEDNKGFHDKI